MCCCLKESDDNSAQDYLGGGEKRDGTDSGIYFVWFPNTNSSAQMQKEECCLCGIIANLRGTSVSFLTATREQGPWVWWGTPAASLQWLPSHSSFVRLFFFFFFFISNFVLFNLFMLPASATHLPCIVFYSVLSFYPGNQLGLPHTAWQGNLKST